MKRIAIIISLFLFFCQAAVAQLQIQTHKEKIKDFPQKVTKVVLTGEEELDAAIRDAIKNYWTISAYELCSEEEFGSLKTNDNYYFLAVADGGEGLRRWYLVKGGNAAAKKLQDMLTVASVAICPAEGLSGREETLLPPIACLLQNLISKAIGSAYGGSGLTISNPGKAVSKPLYLCQDEFSLRTSVPDQELCQKKNIHLVSADQADQIILNAEDAAVCFVVAPTLPAKGDVFYVYLVDASTFEIYYFKKHKVSTKYGCGLMEEDLKAFLKGRK